MDSKLRYWLPIAFVITVIFPTMYVLTQQMARQGAYDPQVQMAQEIANSLSGGARLDQTFLPKTELTKSLSPFIIIYDKDGEVMSATATLNGKTPQLPAGVFAYAKATGQDRFTWQPANGVREATIVTYFSGKNEGYVLTGRSMQEVEKRTEHSLIIAVAGWLVALVGSYVLTMLLLKAPRKK